MRRRSVAIDETGDRRIAVAEGDDQVVDLADRLPVGVKHGSADGLAQVEHGCHLTSGTSRRRWRDPGGSRSARQEAGRTCSLVLSAPKAPTGLGPSSTVCRSLGAEWDGRRRERSPAPPECSPGPLHGQRNRADERSDRSEWNRAPVARWAPVPRERPAGRKYYPGGVPVRRGRRALSLPSLRSNVHAQPTDPPRTPDPSWRRIRRAWWAFAGTFIALVAIVIIQLLSGAADPIELLVGALVLGVGAAAIEHRSAVADLEAGRRSEAESFVRILSNLSRSVSPDAVVAAIVDELARTTGADHIVVARRRTGRAHPRGTPHQRAAGRRRLVNHVAHRRPGGCSPDRGSRPPQGPGRHPRARRGS